ncbi:hypothetical protein DASB73_031750 [Starmerella bacillaris]|uniref:RING-type domain-containing protein n=1 Tax=Starmerella bacillaris TaxID=1247836 RepID=A0AAV5RM72_STABA|nr:hypothetical protein DASB73_031750 [Starmerella bacillaris]
MQSTESFNLNRVPRKPVIPPRLDLVGARRMLPPADFENYPRKKLDMRLDINKPMNTIVTIATLETLKDSKSTPLPASPKVNRKRRGSPPPCNPYSPGCRPPLPSSPYSASADGLSTPLAQIMPAIPSEPPAMNLLPRQYNADEFDSDISSDYENAEVLDGRASMCPSLIALAGITTKCSICGDNSLRRLDALEVMCGHFVHRICLKECEKEGLTPGCKTCGQDCVYVNSNSNQKSDLPIEAESPRVDSANNFDINILDNELRQRSVRKSCPISVQRFSRSDKDRHEMLISVTAQDISGSSEYTKYTLTEADIKYARSAALDALGTCQFSGVNIRESKIGKMRLTSTFMSNNEKLTAYLFDYCIILTKISDGFDSLVDLINLSDDDLVIYPLTNSLVVKRTGTEGISRLLQASRTTISKWIAGINNSSLNFPIAPLQANGLAPPLEPMYFDAGCLDLVVCLPFEYLDIIPSILAKLGPQDRLGVVTSTKTYKTAWISPHKPGWAGWNKFRDMDLDLCDEFNDSSCNALDTAQMLYNDTHYGTQMSVIFVAGCSFDYDTQHTWGIPIHTVGCGELNIEVFRQISKRTGGQYLYAESDMELAACVSGIAAAERTYRYHDVALYVEPAEGLKTTMVIGDETVKLDETDQIEIPLGSLLCGQTKTVQLELRGTCKNNQRLLNVCQLHCKNAVNEHRITTNVTGYINPWTANCLHFYKFAQMTIDTMDMCRDKLELGEHNACCDMLRKISTGILQASSGLDSKAQNSDWAVSIIENANPGMNTENTIAKCKALAHGVRELSDKIEKNRYLPRAGRAILNEAQDILRYKRAVTNRSALERVFL